MKNSTNDKKMAKLRNFGPTICNSICLKLYKRITLNYSGRN